jgi:hypothetical protein
MIDDDGIFVLTGRMLVCISIIIFVEDAPDDE